MDARVCVGVIVGNGVSVAVGMGVSVNSGVEVGVGETSAGAQEDSEIIKITKNESFFMMASVSIILPPFLRIKKRRAIARRLVYDFSTPKIPALPCAWTGTIRSRPPAWMHPGCGS